MEDSKKSKIILFLTLEEIRPKEGISKKILAQVRAFEENGYKCLLGRFDYSPKGEILYKIGDRIVQSYERSLLGRIKARYNFSGIIDFININHNSIKFIYIRYTKFANFGTISLFREIRKHIPIFLEIPTYPYDGENRLPLFRRYRIWEEKLCRKILISYVCKVITFSSDTCIFGKPTIQINNAINLSTIQIRHPLNKDNTFNLIGVADLSFWHGYDRVIEGIKEFVTKENNAEVVFHIVGGHPGKKEYDKLYSLVKKYKLDAQVKLYGTLSGDELDCLFDIADVAIGCLGCHRKGIAEVQSLKNVEYAARGIPFIYSEINKNFDSQDYVFKAPPDDTSIDIQNLIEKTRSISLMPEDIRKSVLDFTWCKQMAKIISFSNYCK